VPQPFNVRVRQLSRTVVVTPTGELDLGTEPALRAAIERLEGAYDALVLDLSQLEFVDSTGLNLAIREHLRASLDGFRLVLVQGPEDVQRVFELAGLDGFLPFAPDLPTALGAPR
jgi:anti-anti-sigma factor